MPAPMDLESLRSAAVQWVSWDPNEETRSGVERLIAEDDVAGLTEAFGTRISFGTAGLRGEMGPGCARVNDLTALQTAQGLVKYLESHLGSDVLKKRGVVIGFDHRERGTLTSRGFAAIMAAACRLRGVKVILLREIVATPMVPFAVQRFTAAAGIMVTCSHNPRPDGGIKIYWENAVQLLAPHDVGIAKSIEDNLEPWDEQIGKAKLEDLLEAAKDQDADKTNGDQSLGAVEDVLDEVADAYFEEVARKLCRFKEDNAASELKIAYSAMHGVGHRWARKSFEAFGLPPFVPVAAQVEPDPDFPTTPFPNPEEKGALDPAIEAADSEDCTLILANDPDADRLAVAEKKTDGSGWRVFTGNEIGTLLGVWQWTNWQKNKQNVVASGSDDTNEDGEEKDVPKKRVKHDKGVAMIASTVSSKMLRAVGEKEGFRFDECLTGFKWIGNHTIELRDEGFDVIFGFEEAIGFCLGDIVPDKDGISGMAVFAEMANQLKKEGKTCADYYDDLSKKYGYFITNNGYVLSRDVEANKRVFAALGGNGKYVETCGKYKVKYVRDLLSPGFDNSQPDNKPTLPVSSSSSMLTFTFENGCVVTLRMSGTEPKLKYYCEMGGSDPEKVRAELDDLVENGIRGEWLKELIK